MAAFLKGSEELRIITELGEDLGCLEAPLASRCPWLPLGHGVQPGTPSPDPFATKGSMPGLCELDQMTLRSCTHGLWVACSQKQ